MADDSDYRLDKRRIRAAFDHSAAHYDEVAVLQREVGRRLTERLDLVRFRPQQILDLGAGTGGNSRALLQHYPQARVISADLAPAMVHEARRQGPRWQRWRGRHGFLVADMERLPLADASVDMVFSNLTLQWSQDPERVFAECRRVLRPGGMLMYTTLGPDTLKELRQSWQVADGYVHVNAFMDMHDVGDAMVRARLAEPVMDVEYFTLTYADVDRLMYELKVLGAHNINGGRARGLTGRGRVQRMREAYEAHRTDGRLPVTYEVVYGHAWAPLQTTTQTEAGSTTVVSFPQLQRSLRGGP